MKKTITGTLALMLVLAPVFAKGNREPRFFEGKRIIQSITQEFAYPVEAIFPLLCPVREYEWMASWKGTIVYTDSGYAEKYTVFYHGIPFPLLFKKAYWTATGYIPNEMIQWCVTVPGICIIIIDETMTQLEGEKTRIDYRYTVTGVSSMGNRLINKMFSEESLARETERTKDEIEYYLATGAMLPTKYVSALFD